MFQTLDTQIELQDLLCSGHIQTETRCGGDVDVFSNLKRVSDTRGKPGIELSQLCKTEVGCRPLPTAVG